VQQGDGDRPPAMAALAQAVDHRRIGGGPEQDAVVLPDQLGDAVAGHRGRRRIGEDDRVVRLVRVGDDHTGIGDLDHLDEEPGAQGVGRRLPGANGFTRRRRGGRPLVGSGEGMGLVRRHRSVRLIESDILQTPGQGGTQRTRLVPAQRYPKAIHQDGELVLLGIGKDGGPLRNNVHSDYRGREQKSPVGQD